MSIFNALENDSERAEREYQEGQKEGSQAGIIAKIGHDLVGGGSDAYNKGWDNGVNNPSNDDDD
jgi:hypothetical protein